MLASMDLMLNAYSCALWSVLRCCFLIPPFPAPWKIFQCPSPQLSMDSTCHVESYLVLSWHFPCLVFLPCLLQLHFLSNSFWVSSYWCTSGCSGFHQGEWLWHSPNTICPLYDWCTISVCWIWGGNFCTLWGASWSSHQQLPCLSLASSVYLQRTKWLAGHRSWWWGSCSCRWVGSSDLFLGVLRSCWLLCLLMFPYHCGITRYL